MSYLEYINNLIRLEMLRHDRVVAFGQNVSAGSFLGGLTKDLSVRPDGHIINTINAENTLIGFGFGLALAGMNAVFFMRQLDFLLLGTDHLVNTYNSIRNRRDAMKGSFTIMTTIIDQGYEGPQSSLNTLSDFCSMARVSGYTITNKIDAAAIIQNQLVAPGFRIIAGSPRLYKEDLIAPRQLLFQSKELDLFQYEDGPDVTIVCFNLAFPYGVALAEECKQSGVQPALFSISAATPVMWQPIIRSLKKTKKLIIINDAKGANLSHHPLLAEAHATVSLKKTISLVRDCTNIDWLRPGPDRLEFSYRAIVAEIKQK